MEKGRLGDEERGKGGLGDWGRRRRGKGGLRDSGTWRLGDLEPKARKSGR